MTDDLQHIISSKRELLARGDAPRPAVNYTEGMPSDQKDRFIEYLTAVPLKWASRSLKQLKHSLLEEVFHVRRFESVILQPINGLLYEQKQICVRTIG